MLFLQIATTVVSLLLGLTQMAKEARPLVQQQVTVPKTATEISQMPIQWQYRSHDQEWAYYSDYTGRYWCRVSPQGIKQYAQQP